MSNNCKTLQNLPFKNYKNQEFLKFVKKTILSLKNFTLRLQNSVLIDQNKLKFLKHWIISNPSNPKCKTTKIKDTITKPLKSTQKKKEIC